MKKLKFYPYLCQNPKNLAQSRFPAKIMKHVSPNMSETTKLIEMKISLILVGNLSRAKFLGVWGK